MSFPNIWHHRKVADTSAKACELCFKPSTSVLFNPENKVGLGSYHTMNGERLPDIDRFYLGLLLCMPCSYQG